jgi:hypothetical protein
MRQAQVGMCVVLMLLCSVFTQAQQSVATAGSAVVPSMVNFSGVLTGLNGKPSAGSVGVTFSLNKDQEGGAPLWVETQNVKPNSTGHYTVALGSTASQGMPANVFASGEARWLGVQVEGQAEQPRVLLMSVPYALKALDAETIGGRPASSFMLAPASSGSSKEPTAPGGITGSGTADFVPLFTGATTIGNSKIFQSAAGHVGIGTTSPAGELDVKGTSDVRDTLTLFPKSTHATLEVHGTAFEISSTGLVTFTSGQTFPGTGTVTSVASGDGLTGGPITGSGTLSVATGGITNTMLAHSSLTVTANGPLTGGGAVSLGSSTSLGLESCAAGQILQFVSGAWTCANPAAGTVTSVATGVGLKGGPITNSGTLTIDTTVVPQLAGNNSFSGTQTINNIENISVNNGTDGLDVTQAGAGNGIVSGLDNASGIGVKGVNLSTTGTGAGLSGTSESATGYGVIGNSPDVGVYGASDGASNEGSGGGFVGVWGDTGAPAGSGHAGIAGTADENSAGYFANSSSDYETLYVVNDAESSSSATVLETYGGNFGGTCEIDVSGNLGCTGTVQAIATLDGGARKASLYAMQSPENWFEDAGSGQLAGGVARIELDPAFAQTVNAGVEYHVFLTPKGDSEGLYVSNETPQGFEVHEQRGGHSNIAFDYRIMAKRVGYENVRLADITERFNKQEMNRKKMRHAILRSGEGRAKSLTPPRTLNAAGQPSALQHK